MIYHHFFNYKIIPESNGSLENNANSTASLPTSAQDGTMAETQTNGRNNMEYIAPRFHCPTPNVYHPFFTMNLNITFTHATPLSICNTHPPLPLAPHPSSVPLPSHSSPITLSSEYISKPHATDTFKKEKNKKKPWRSWRNQWCPEGLQKIRTNGHFFMVDGEAGAIESEEQVTLPSPAFHGNGRGL
ncbi:unnamed protein product [Bursaphelenchus xylophilus]|uniref:(pine wood nematode) hypothetical protein n=1 Tax=Bursaphelenchus xylophilus TaxID=6326 RepID=A0A811M945_BURXY|nr:unnamed protein product [Bursaphelenchus xylophilus]CAG9132683.1 unnamed protein product [Bursaphelenchus xylophilus]